MASPDRRAALAFIAMAAAPTPQRIAFDGSTNVGLSMGFDSISDLRMWLVTFGVPDEPVHTQTIDRDGVPATLATAHPMWSGMRCYLSAVDPADPVDPDGGEPA